MIKDYLYKKLLIIKPAIKSERIFSVVTTLCFFGASGFITGAVVASDAETSLNIEDMRNQLAAAQISDLQNTHPDADTINLASLHESENPSKGKAPLSGAQNNTSENQTSDPQTRKKTQVASLPNPNTPIKSDETAISGPMTRILTVDNGDTLMDMLIEEGLDRRDAHKAIAALTKIFSPRKLKPGHELSLTLQPIAKAVKTNNNTKLGLSALTITASPIETVVVTTDKRGGFKAEKIETPTRKITTVASGIIESSLYESALDSGVPNSVLASMIQVFSFDIDFQREVQKGDTFSLIYDVVRAGDQLVDTGPVHMAEMSVNGQPKRFYRFQSRDGFWGYYDEKGRTAKKALLRTPVDGARISSGFGKRRHPILGYTKMHKGTDFAAPTGTPIYAAGNGIVEASGTRGAYGKYIRIRHNNTYKTAYAHMSRIAVKKGRKVRQGQIIGYVGSTGRSTGPHLHYEVHKNGRQVNPLGVKLPTGQTLGHDELKAFRKRVKELEKTYVELQKIDENRNLASAQN